jgi:hypothetical protein
VSDSSAATASGLVFYLGTHMPNWLATSDVPLFVSRRRLTDRKTLPEARTTWALDSGGFTELSMYGEWRTSVKEYALDMLRFGVEIGELAWVSSAGLDVRAVHAREDGQDDQGAPRPDRRQLPAPPRASRLGCHPGLAGMVARRLLVLLGVVRPRWRHARG